MLWLHRSSIKDGPFSMMFSSTTTTAFNNYNGGGHVDGPTGRYIWKKH